MEDEKEMAAIDDETSIRLADDDRTSKFNKIHQALKDARNDFESKLSTLHELGSALATAQKAYEKHDKIFDDAREVLDVAAMIIDFLLVYRDAREVLDVAEQAFISSFDGHSTKKLDDQPNSPSLNTRHHRTLMQQRKKDPEQIAAYDIVASMDLSQLEIDEFHRQIDGFY